MPIQFHKPSSPLDQYVEYIYFLEGDEMGTGIAFQRAQQVIIINLGDRFTVNELFEPLSREKETNQDIWINGKQETSFVLGNRGTTAMYAIGVKLGMLPFFTGFSTALTNERALGSEHWAAKEIFELREQLYEASISEGFILIEKFLSKGLVKSDDYDHQRILWLSQSLSTLSVEAISAQLNKSRKQLRKEAIYYFGDSIKGIQGILRFNDTLTAIAHNCDETLSSVHHYYDQAHFIRDFKLRSGITPSQYRRICSMVPEIKHTPNFIPLKKETFLQFIR